MELNLDTTELEELLWKVYDYSEKEQNEMFDTDEYLHTRLRDKFDGSVEDFVHDLVSRLMPLCVVGQSPLTKKFFKGFGVEKNGGAMMICKMAAK